MIYLLLGSNIEDAKGRAFYLSEARRLLSEKLQVELYCTEIIETEAVGFEGGAFLNQVVKADYPIDNEDDALKLLNVCQGIEIAIGRPAHSAVYNARGERVYSDRVIDIDILDIDGFTMENERLRIPHPQVEEREFAGRLLKLCK